MRAAQIVAPRTLKLLETNPPQPKSGELLVRLRYLTICGSDTRIFRGSDPELEYPLPIGFSGHECVGEVESSFHGSFRPGDRILALPLHNRGLADRIVIPASRATHLPTTDDLGFWALCQPLGTVVYACRRLDLFESIRGKSVVILGQGPIGLCFVPVLLQFGAEQVITVDPVDYRLSHGQHLGSSLALNPESCLVKQEVDKVTKGRGPDIVIEASGKPEAIRHAIQLARFQGTVLLFGIPAENPQSIDVSLSLRKMVNVIPAMNSSIDNPIVSVRRAIDMVRRRTLSLDSLITHRVGFEHIQWAFETYELQADNCLKILLEF